MSTANENDNGDNIEENPDEDKILWKKNEEKYFIDLMVSEVREGNLTSSTFHPRVWAQIELKMNQTLERVYSVKRLKEKFQRLKKKFRAFKDLIGSTGMGWNEEKNTVVGSEDNWRNAIAKNKEAKQFRKKGCDHYKLLQEIFDKSTATGQFARASTQEPLNSDEEQEVEEVYLRGPNFKNPIDIESDVGGFEGGPSNSKYKKKGKTKTNTPSAAMDEAWVAIKQTQTTKRELYERASGLSKNEECVDILESMDNISRDQYIAAIVQFRDPSVPPMFLRMSAIRRTEWLDSIVT